LTFHLCYPLFVEALFDFSLGQLHAEADWIARTLRHLETSPTGNKANTMEKLDFKKKLKALYFPSASDFVLVDVPKMQFLMIDGTGSPGGDAYSTAVQWLYSVIYPIKFIARKTTGKDFVVPPLEGLWWADDMADFVSGNKGRWKWQMMIVTPDWVSGEMFDEAVAKAAKKLGDAPKSLRLADFDEGRCVQIMHIGPYADEGPTIARLHKEFLPANGLTVDGHHHEIYLGDPRRTAPEKLNTVLRQPVK